MPWCALPTETPAINIQGKRDAYIGIHYTGGSHTLRQRQGRRVRRYRQTAGESRRVADQRAAAVQLRRRLWHRRGRFDHAAECAAGDTVLAERGLERDFPH